MLKVSALILLLCAGVAGADEPCYDLKTGKEFPCLHTHDPASDWKVDWDKTLCPSGWEKSNYWLSVYYEHGAIQPETPEGAVEVCKENGLLRIRPEK